MSDVCLVVLFNHRYDRNLPLLEDIYRDRFSDRFYLVPFYDGDMVNVIPVYGRSIFFESYIAQGANVFMNKDYKHYLIVADDMVLHPGINEHNYRDFFEVTDSQSFVPDLIPLQDMGKYWIGTMSAFYYRRKQKYIEAAKEFMPEEEAMQKMQKQGIEIRPLTRKELFGEFTLRFDTLGHKSRLLIRTLTRICHPFKKTYRLDYPLIGSYSDIVLVSNNDMKDFAHYCGLFGATALFAEVAIPTALVLAANDKIVTEKVTRRGGRAYWQGSDCPFWKSDEYYQNNIDQMFSNLDDMMQNFPDTQLYIHPVKLSKWAKK